MTPARLALVALLAGLLTPLSATAQGIYRYVEKDGTIIYTNVPPPKAKKASKLEGTFHSAPRSTEKPAPLPRVRNPDLADLDAFIDAASRRYKVPAPLVRAVMHAESNFDPNALSPKGASGLMQLMPATAEDMYVKDIFDVRDNIEGGTRYLRVLANQFNGDMVKMIAAYNAGPEAVRRYGGKIPPYEETQAYVRKVLDLYYQYKARAQAAAEASGGGGGGGGKAASD